MSCVRENIDGRPEIYIDRLKILSHLEERREENGGGEVKCAKASRGRVTERLILPSRLEKSEHAREPPEYKVTTN